MLGKTTSPNSMSTCMGTCADPSRASNRILTPWYSASSVICSARTFSAEKTSPSGSTSVVHTSRMIDSMVAGLLSITPRKSMSTVGRVLEALHASMRRPGLFENEPISMPGSGKPRHEPSHRVVLQEFIERAAGVAGLIEKASMYGRS